MVALADKLGCSTITFRHQALAGALESIRAAGLQKVDIACIPGFCPHINPLEISDLEVQALKDLLSDMGMSVSTLNVSAGGLNTERKEFVYNFIRAALTLAPRLGCYAITIPSGARVADAAWEQNADVSAGSIRQLADQAAENGILLTLEAPHTGTLAETIPETARFFQVLADPRVACTFDTSHVARGNPVPVEKCIAAIGAPVGHLHLRDCIDSNNHLTPGKGQIDFRATLLELSRAGYSGDIILELEGEDSQQAAGELAFAIRYLNGLDL